MVAKNGVTVQCHSCGQDLYRRPWQLKRHTNHFCSRECIAAHQRTLVGPLANDYKSIEVICAQCGSKLLRRPSEINSAVNHFCNRQCHAAWKAKWPAPDGYQLNTVQCAYCRKPLTRHACRVRRSDKLFCNLKCAGAWRSENMVGEKSPFFMGVGTESRPCAACGKEISRPRSGFNKRHTTYFCDRQCRSAYWSKIQVGENHRLWRGGRQHYYGPNWHYVRRKVRERDNHTCCHCGTKHKIGERSFAVHHIQPFRDFGYVPGKNENYKQANKLTNLITLCATCHMKVEHGKVPLQLPLL